MSSENGDSSKIPKPQRWPAVVAGAAYLTGLLWLIYVAYIATN